MIYTNSTLEKIYTGSPYIDSHGTQYPAGWDLSTLPELHEVTQTDMPPNATGWHIESQQDGSYLQVWDIKTPEEIKQQFNNSLQIQLDNIDAKKIRALSDAILTGDNTRLVALESEAAAVRAQWQH